MSNIQNGNIENDDTSLKDIILAVKDCIGYLKPKWWKIAIAGILGSAIGFFYAYSRPVTYIAKLTFVVEEGKSSGGGLAALAGQFGFDVGGMGGGNGLLNGENLLLFLKSNSLTQEVLLSPFDSVRNYSLADKYADVYELREQWAKNKKIGKYIFFPSTSEKPYTRLQDSLLHSITEMILKKELTVDRPEKKASFILVQSNMKHELLSKFYCERLVEQATLRYIQAKTKRQNANVNRLQTRADSIASALNSKTYTNASAQEKILDINPGTRTVTVNAEISGRDKIMLGTIYSEVVKNLEIAKVQLTQETPTIQIVDDIDLPLKKVKASKLIWLVMTGILGAFLFVAYTLFNRWKENAFITK